MRLAGYLVLAVVAGLPLTVRAQQGLPRPIVLYRPAPTPATQPRGPAVVTSSALPQTARPSVSTAPAPGGSGGTATVNRAAPAAPRPASTTASGRQDEAEDQRTAAAREWAQQQSRPTIQMLQNPSAAWNLTHSGFSTQQQMAPNVYFGQQFQTWSNQQPVSEMAASAGELPRFQPAQFGGYVGPNTYLGSGFFDWNNLSQGAMSPGATGSWNISVWGR